MKSIFNLFWTVIFFNFSPPAFGQAMLQPEPTRTLEKQASEMASMWEDELSLTAKQYDLMRRKIIEFALKKEKVVQSSLSEKRKSKKLVRLQILENRDMRDILTKPQYDRYIYLLLQREKEYDKRKTES